MNNLNTISDNSLTAKLAEAELYSSQGLDGEAGSIYTELLDLIKDQSHPVYKEAKIRLKKLQHNDKKHNSLKGANLSSRSRDPDKKIDNCIGLMEAGFYPEAVAELKALLETGYRPGIVHTKIAESYLQMDMPFDALEHLQQALEDPGLSETERLNLLNKLALTHERTGAVGSAIDILKQIVNIDPNFRNAAQRLEGLSQSAQRYGRFYYLVRNHFLSEEELKEAKELAKRDKSSIENTLMNQFSIEKSEIGRSLSEYYQCPFIEFDEIEVGPTPSCVHGIKEHFFRSNNCIPVREEAETLLVALDDPHDREKIDNVRRILKAKEFQFAVAVKEDIDKFIDYFYGKYSIEKDNIFEHLELEKEEQEEPVPDVDLDADNVVVQMANKIIEDAYQRQASDIHIEALTGRQGAHTRFRIDGECMPYQAIPYNYKQALISRFKIMANLDIAEKRLPQDGKIKFRIHTGKTIGLRVVTIPTIEGNEDIVLRILAGSDTRPIDRIGLLNDNLEQLLRILTMPYGLILVVGPTGSGKTTTLHSILGHINRPEKKIWTVEDPVEIVQDGLRQVQVKPHIGLTFPRVLRAFLRADPDIIMVGETRDEETATTVIEASLTGHLVFSTLHTNSAPETLTRLLEMGMDPFNFADALLGVLAQRLVKRLCPKCREAYQPDEEEKRLMLKEYGIHPVRPLELSDLDNITLYRPKGCPYCNGTGYRGRLAIHELLISDDGLKKFLQERRPVAEIRDYAIKHGMLTLKQDGIRKVLIGDTDLRQVKRACIR
ncbi:MAG: type II/IV secretion system protein [Nitrospiraceae bacterium]|nr:type II/IV secretion system protein [Nitrospiraceae bacterium]